MHLLITTTILHATNYKRRSPAIILIRPDSLSNQWRHNSLPLFQRRGYNIISSLTAASSSHVLHLTTHGSLLSSLNQSSANDSSLLWANLDDHNSELPTTTNTVFYTTGRDYHHMRTCNLLHHGFSRPPFRDDRSVDICIQLHEWITNLWYLEFMRPLLLDTYASTS